MDFSKISKDYEFILKINDHIICQRYFNVNNFNRRSIRSLELKAAGDICVDWIIEHLKTETNLYMMKYENYFNHDPSFDSQSRNSGDNYYFTIQHQGRPVYQRIFTADLYPSRVRNSVNIKGIISPMISEITDVLSQPTRVLTCEYAGYNLSKV